MRLADVRDPSVKTDKIVKTLNPPTLLRSFGSFDTFGIGA